MAPTRGEYRSITWMARAPMIGDGTAGSRTRSRDAATRAGPRKEARLIAIVLVTHSLELGRGLAALMHQAAPSVQVRTAAGAGSDGRLGISVPRVEAALRSALADAGADPVVVFLDLGSAAMALEVALDALPAGERRRVHASDASLVEGAIGAAVAAAGGAPIEHVLAAAAAAAALPKLPADWPETMQAAPADEPTNR